MADTNYRERPQMKDIYPHITEEMLFDQIPCYITIQDKNGEIIKCNRLFREVFGDRKGEYCYEVYKHRDEKCAVCPMDRIFNGLNSVSEKIFTGTLASYLGRVSRDGPVRAVLLFLAPGWGLTGTTGEKLAQKRLNIQKAIETGTSPIGISAAVATIFVIVIFLLK